MPIPGGWELVVILGVLVLLFGATRLPKAAEGIGKALKVFKREVNTGKDGDDQDDTATRNSEPKTEAEPKAIDAQSNGTAKAEDVPVTHQKK